jgi:hypothetical protein
MRICLVNKSLKYRSDQIGLAQIAQALSWQAAHAAKLLDLGVHPAITIAPPTVATDLELNFFDHALQDGALGDHYEEGGKPVMEVFLDPIIESGGGMTNQGNAASTCASHEMLEMLYNPRINRWADMPNGDDVALEVGDPVEADFYFAPNNVAVSNFVTPAWFDPQAEHPQKFDYMGKLQAPFTRSKNGYMVVRTEPGKVSDTFQKLGDSGSRVVGVIGRELSKHKIAKLKAKYLRANAIFVEG